jgi:erythromycin esterase-like protein
MTITRAAPKTQQIIAESARPLDYAQIVDAVPDDVRVVMIGEASHGTYDFYRHRAEISKRLIEQKGFTIVALESDFPDTERVNKYVTNKSRDNNVNQSLSEFSRYPLWMWRNTVMTDFVDWLKWQNLNSSSSSSHPTRIFGLDIYSFESSKQAVLQYIEQHHPSLYEHCKKTYEFGEYASSGVRLSEIVLKELDYLASRGQVSEELFSAIHNAKIVRAAAKYGRSSSWNVRDTAMMEGLEHIIDRYGGKVIIWAHNSHLGDASKTDSKDSGEINLGQLVREKYGSRCMNIGFTTYTGTVTATSEWDEPAQFFKVNKGMDGSVEQLFHDISKRVSSNEFVLYFRNTTSNVASQEVINILSKPLQERAIGVNYLPRTEKYSHYFKAKIAQQFDIMIHVDESSALRPLDIPVEWSRAERALC